MKKNHLFLLLASATFSTTNCSLKNKITNFFKTHEQTSSMNTTKTTLNQIQTQNPPKTPQTYTYVNIPYVQGLKSHTLYSGFFWTSLMLLNFKGTLPWWLRIVTTIVEGMHILDAYTEEKESNNALTTATIRGKRDAYVIRTIISVLHLLELSKRKKDFAQPFVGLNWQ